MDRDWCYNRPLFNTFPALKEKVLCLDLGSLPTPIVRLKGLEKQLSCNVQIYMKDDGVTGKVRDGRRSFGGNKVRKLEFLLADALVHDAKSIMTYGCIGSNHVVATASLSNMLGLSCIAMLMPQPVTDVVKRNLLLMHENKCSMIFNSDKKVRTMQTICLCMQHEHEYGKIPYFVPTGGSCPIGIIGYVNAVFELKQQIEAGILPEPSTIYVAAGTGGTLAGLVLGVKAAGLTSHVVGIAVEPEEKLHDCVDKVCTLADKTNLYLHDKDPNFPCYIWNKSAVTVHLDSAGPDYGIVTDEALHAITLFKLTDNVQLDTTYTGKAAAGMLKELKRGNDNGVVLFWNTFCSDVKVPIIKSREMPLPFRKYLEL